MEACKTQFDKMEERVMNIIINQRVTERCRPGESVRCILALHHKHHHRTRTDARLDLGYQYLAQDDMMMFTVLAREKLGE